MLGRKTFTRDEIDRARTLVEHQLAAYDALVGDADPAARAAFEEQFGGTLLLALDRPFVHRVRNVSGKDGNPLNEVELLVEALLDHGGVLRGNTVIRYVPEESVTGLRIGDPVRLTREQFDALARAFSAELEARFLEA